MNAPVPDPDGLTATWFAAVLKSNTPGGARIDPVSIKPVEPQGWASRTFRATLRGDCTPASVIVKMARTERSYLERRLNLGTYRLEVDFYQLLAPQLGELVPECYYAAADDADGRFILVLEDLGQDGSAPTPVTQRAMAAVRTIAKIHAHYDGDASVAEMFDRCALPGMFDQRQIGATEKSIFESLVNEALESNELPERVVAAARAQIAHFDRLSECLREQRMTCVHGDFHLSQVLERDGSDGGACVIDWQTPMFANGALDLQRLVFGSLLTPPERRDLERQVIGEYHRTLASSGIVDYTLDELRGDYRLALHHTLMRALMPAEERALGRSGDRGRAAMAMLEAAIADLEYIDLIETL